MIHLEIREKLVEKNVALSNGRKETRETVLREFYNLTFDPALQL